MKNLRVSKIIGGGFAVTTDDGQKIYDLIDHSLSKKELVDLDFKNVQILTTAFLNAAIGQLYSKYDTAAIRPYLKLSNVADEDKILFKKVTDRAKQYFTERESFEKNSDYTIYGQD